MQKNALGRTELKVTNICLGTMTWGKQNTQQEGFTQLDAALDYGVNFIDTAEMYAVPAEASTYGTTETIVGHWLKTRSNRDKVILASKIAGPGAPGWIGHIRGGQTRFNSRDIDAALHGSLKRLQTDYIDLYQLHWPERNTNFFGKLGYRHKEEQFTPPSRNPRSPAGTYKGRQDSPHRCFKRNPLGRNEIPGRFRSKGATPHRVHTKPLQLAQPQL